MKPLTESHPSKVRYSVSLPNTANPETKSGPIFRYPGFENKEFLKTFDPSVQNLYNVFEFGKKRYPKGNFLGHREMVDGKAGPYVWKSYEETETLVEAYRLICIKLDLYSVTCGALHTKDGRPIETMGHYLRNCPELIISQYAAWKHNAVCVTLYDSLGPDAMSFILHESEIKSILVSSKTGLALLQNQNENGANYVFLKNYIVIGDVPEEMRMLAQANNVSLYSFDKLIEEGMRYVKRTVPTKSPLVPASSTPSSTTTESIGKSMDEQPEKEEEHYADDEHKDDSDDGVWESLSPELSAKMKEQRTAHYNDACMLCYTSGTTGPPKGAILTHGNYISVGTVVKIYVESMKLTSNDRHCSYLPMAHCFEQFIHVLVVSIGASIGFSQGNPATLTDDFKELQPTMFASVPRLFSKIIDSIVRGANASGGLKKKLFWAAVNAKQKHAAKTGVNSLPFWDRLVFSKILKMIGLSQVKFIVSGSAPISDHTLQMLRVIFRCPVVQGLGLTETAGGICCSSVFDQGTVGHCGSIIQCAEAKLVSIPEMGYNVEDTHHGRQVDPTTGQVLTEGIPCQGRGEVCFRGENVIPGYYRRPEMNAAVFDKEGWFHSGDIGLWNVFGAIQIVDRKKDIFKLSQGEYISPDKVSEAYTRCPIIGNIYVYGDSLQAFLVAIVIPDEQNLRSVLRDRCMDEADMSFEQICSKASVKKVVMEEMNKVAQSSKLSGLERIKNIKLDHVPWTVDNGMFTPTMKLKREVSKAKYKSVIDAMYAEGELKL